MKKNYFFLASSFLLLLSIIAFSDNLIFDVGQQSNSDPKFIIHGLFFFAWFIILVIQSGFIRRSNVKGHQTLGVLGMIIGLGVVLSTFYVFYSVYKGWSVMPFYVKANRFFTVTFAVLVLMAYLKKSDRIIHKLFLFVGTLYVLGLCWIAFRDISGLRVSPEQLSSMPLSGMHCSFHCLCMINLHWGEYIPSAGRVSFGSTPYGVFRSRLSND